MSAGNSRLPKDALNTTDAAQIEERRTSVLKRYQDMVRDKTLSTEGQADLVGLPDTLSSASFAYGTKKNAATPIMGAADAVSSYLDQTDVTTNILGKRERERLRRDELTRLTTDSPTMRASRAGGFSLLTGRGQGPTLLT